MIDIIGETARREIRGNVAMLVFVLALATAFYFATGIVETFCFFSPIIVVLFGLILIGLMEQTS